MDKTEREELRDRAALSALSGMLAKGNYDRMKLVEDAYKIADAFVAARGLPDRYEEYTNYFRRENAQRIVDRIQLEAQRKAFAPLYEWAREHWDGDSLAVLFNFAVNHLPQEGEDIAGEFKEWLKATNPELISCIKTTSLV